MTLETVTEHASWNHMFVSSSSFPVEHGLINVISRSDKIYKQETGLSWALSEGLYPVSYVEPI